MITESYLKKRLASTQAQLKQTTGELWSARTRYLKDRYFTNTAKYTGLSLLVLTGLTALGLTNYASTKKETLERELNTDPIDIIREIRGHTTPIYEAPIIPTQQPKKEPELTIPEKQIQKTEYRNPEQKSSKKEGQKVRLPKTRGVRNNNPGNIRAISRKRWAGQTGVDRNGFCIFSTPEYGLRALMKNLKDYDKIHGADTISEIIQRWAPRYDNNDTANYIRDISQMTGYNPHTELDLSKETLIELAKAISRRDSGAIYPVRTIEEAYELYKKKKFQSKKSK